MLHLAVAMNRIADALELLTAQHDEIDSLLAVVSTSGSPAVRGAAVSELAEKLTLHLAIEQEMLYPTADRTLSDEVRRELMSEHVEIKRVLADLVWLDLDDSRFGGKLTLLQMLLEWHELWQEEELFETLAESMSPAELEDLGVRINGWLEGADLLVAAA